MLEFIWNTFIFTFSVFFLITVHELGHFFAARYFGVAVERFSLGFGKVLWARRGRQGTEFALSAWPLGGYVKFDMQRGPDPRCDEMQSSLHSCPKWQRFIILFAGPFANLLCAFLLGVGFFLLGETRIFPVISHVQSGSIAEAMEWQVGMKIEALHGKKTETSHDVLNALARFLASEKRDLEVYLSRMEECMVTTHIYKIPVADVSLSSTRNPIEFLKALGISLVEFSADTTIAKVVKGGPAKRAGLLPNDRIVMIAGMPCHHWETFVTQVERHPNEPLELLVERGSPAARQNILLTPDLRTDAMGYMKGYVGLVPKKHPGAERYCSKAHYTLLNSIRLSAEKVHKLSWATAKAFGKLLTGCFKQAYLSGPIGIAKTAGQYATLGVTHYLEFLVMLSVNLGMLNLFPLPMLDGGQIAFLGIETLTGRPLSRRFLRVSHWLGLWIVLLLIGLAVFNDLSHLYGSA